MKYTQFLREQNKRVTPSELPTGGSISDLSNDSNFGVISEYMSDRFGMEETEYSKEEIVNSYVDNMRKFNFGQSLVTAQELTYLYSGEGQEREQRRDVANRAYSLFDSLDGLFQEDNTLGQKADGVRDYARALIVDPLNLVSFGLGKVVTSAGTKASTQAIKEVARRSASVMVRDAASRGVRGEALEQLGREAYSKAMADALRSAGAQQVARGTARREIAATGAVDTIGAVGVDAGHQEAMQLVGLQDEYDPIQAAVAAAGGVVGAGLSAGVHSLRGTSGVNSIALSMSRSDEMAEQAVARMSKPEEAAKVIDVNKATEAVDKVLTPFRQYVQKGRLIRESSEREVYERKAGLAFNLGLRQILEESGIPIRSIDAAKGERRSGWLVDLIKDENFPKEVRESLQRLLDSTVNDITGNKLDLEEYLTANTDMASEAGRFLNSFRMTEEIKRIAGVAEPKAEDILDATLNPVSKGLREKLVGNVHDIQKNFIRMLVTHPGTTALNVIGWANASANQSYADMLRGALYGGHATLNSLVGKTDNAVKYRNLSRHMVDLQRQKVRNLLDPESTYREAMDYLTFRPEAQSKMFRYLAGGVESKELIDEVRNFSSEPVNRTNFQKFQGVLETAYGVKAQDMLTKTQEFMYAIDKQLRLKTGMTYNEFISQDNISEIMRNKTFKEFSEIEATALEDSLRNVYSKKFGDSDPRKGMLSYTANIIEEARNIPIIGAMMPFGQFFNNTLGFMFDHTGISLAHKIAKGTSRDGVELVTKAAVGWTAIGAAAFNSYQNMEDGLAWYEERDGDGQVVSRLYDYPKSFFMMAGRISAHIVKDDEVPPELFEEAFKTFGPDAITRQLGEAGGTMYEAIKMLAGGEGEESLQAAKEALTASVGMYASGFTRFADPVNTVLGMAEGEDYVDPNRSIGNKQFNNAIRYTDRILDTIIGLDTIEEASGGFLDASGYSVERARATTDRNIGAPVGRIFGYRAVAPTSTVQKMFRDVGKPDWQTEIRIKDPIAMQTFNQHIFPILETYADQVVGEGRWSRLGLEDRRRVLRSLLSKVRQETKDRLLRSYEGESAGLIYEINNQKSQGARVYREVLDMFEVEERNLSSLNSTQLEIILSMLKDRHSDNRETVEDILP